MNQPRRQFELPLIAAVKQFTQKNIPLMSKVLIF